MRFPLTILETVDSLTSHRRASSRIDQRLSSSSFKSHLPKADRSVIRLSPFRRPLPGGPAWRAVSVCRAVTIQDNLGHVKFGEDPALVKIPGAQDTWLLFSALSCSPRPLLRKPHCDLMPFRPTARRAVRGRTMVRQRLRADSGVLRREDLAWVEDVAWIEHLLDVTLQVDHLPLHDQR